MYRSLAILLMVSFVAVLPSVRAADDAKDIVTKAIKAHGGDETLGKHKGVTTKTKGKLQVPGVGEVDFASSNAAMSPDKFREDVELTIAGNKINILSIANGDSITIEANGMAVPVEDNIKKVFKNAAHTMKVGRLVTLVTDKGFELSLIGESEVNKAKVIGVKVAMKGQDDVNLYFDAKTHYLMKIEARTLDAMTGNEITEERILQDYEKNADGIAIPKKITILRDSKPYMDAEIVEMKYHEKLDDSDFKK